MSCYFIISVFLEPGKDRTDYDDYIRLVRPIVEEYGGRYVVRSEGIEYMGKDWQAGPLYYNSISGQRKH